MINKMKTYNMNKMRKRLKNTHTRRIKFYFNIPNQCRTVLKINDNTVTVCIINHLIREKTKLVLRYCKWLKDSDLC